METGLDIMPALELEGILQTVSQPEPEPSAKLLGEDLLVGVVCSPQEADGWPDFDLLYQAGKDHSIMFERVVWSDAHVLWEAYDAILPLRVWDYTMRTSSFRHWLSEREKDNSRLINSSSLVRWNLDKGYLLELQEFGVPMARTELRVSGSRSAGQWDEGITLVTKPRMGAGGLGVEITPAAAWSPPRRDLIVQEYLPQVAEQGELSVLVVAGTPLGAVRRISASDDFRVGETWGGDFFPEPLSEKASQAALRVLEELPEVPLYARVDLWDFEEPCLLAEVELVEPDLFLRLIPGAADRLAEALKGRLLSSSPPKRLS